VGDTEQAFGQLDNAQFRAQYGMDKPKFQDEMVVLCRSGVRAEKACNTLAKLGYKRYDIQYTAIYLV